MTVLLEIRVEDVAGVRAALTGGADRLELCSALDLGGLTPSPGLMRHAVATGLPVMVMIRPRAGDFIWSPDEVAVMQADIDAARRAGAAGYRHSGPSARAGDYLAPLFRSDARSIRGA